MALPPSLATDSKGRNPKTGGSLSGVADGKSDKTKFATSTSVHPQGPYSPGMLGGEDMPGDEAIMQQMMMQQFKRNQQQHWVSYFDNEFVKAKNARANFERQWYLNLAFVGGKHYVSPIDIAGQGFRLATPKAPPWRVRLTINKILTAVLTECAKLTSSKPIPTVVPATGEDEDYASAAVGEALVRTQFANEDFADTVRQWVWWGSVCGCSYIKSYWNATALDYEAMQLPDTSELPPLPNGQPMNPEMLEVLKQVSPELQQFLDTPRPAVGKIEYERITPFHIYVPDLLAEKLDQQPFIIQVMTRDKDWVKRAFPDAYPGDLQPECDAKAASTIMDSVAIITKGAEDQNDAVLVKEVWIKPFGHPDFPKGGMLTIVGSKVVQEKTEWPCPFPEYPFYMYRGVPTGGFYTDSIVQHLIPLNKEYNRTRSQVIEIKNTMGKPKILYQQGSLDPRMINSEPGQSIPYKPGFNPPTPINGVEAPQTFDREIQTLTQEFDDISGQHEISRGGAPADVKSGTAISFLAEQDDTKLSYKIASISFGMQLIGKHHLCYISKYWDSDRLVKISGRDNQYEALSWKQNALRGNTDVRIQDGSALPVSKAARTAQITEFMMNGWLPPEEGLEMLNMGGMDKVLDEILVDKKQAYRENLKMAQAPAQMLGLFQKPAPGPMGEPVPPPVEINGQQIQINADGTPFAPKSAIPVNSWDNHEAHIQYHNQFRKTQEFEVLPPENKQEFELHIQTHQMALQSQLVNAQGNVIQDNSAQPPAVGQEEVPPEENGTKDGPPLQE